MSTTVSSTLVDSLPVQVNGTSRSPFDLASAAAGEVNSAGTFRIGGGNDTVGVTLDGSSITGDKIGSDAGDGGATAMNSPSVEALTEFTVESSGFKAETGHVSGGVLSFVSKSGTNQFHGSAFEYLRNQDFDAKTFFANANNSPKSIYKQNNFGVTAGGPVCIPKLYNGKNKTFFFASYEGFRNRVGAATGTFSSVPPTQFYSGDLSDWVNGSGVLYQVYDPTSQVQIQNGTYTKTPFPGNQIPQTKFDPTAAIDRELSEHHTRAEPPGHRAGDVRLRESKLHCESQRHHHHPEQSVERQDRREPGREAPHFVPHESIPGCH